MRSQRPSPPSSWRTVRLLLGAARKRAAGRRKRQQELLRQRAQNSTDWSGLGFALTVLLMAALNIGAAFVVRIAVASGERIEVERKGKIVGSRYFMDQVQTAIRYPAENGPTLPSTYCSSEAQEIAERHGGTQAAIEQKFEMHSVRTELGIFLPKMTQLFS